MGSTRGNSVPRRRRRGHPRGARGPAGVLRLLGDHAASTSPRSSRCWTDRASLRPAAPASPRDTRRSSPTSTRCSSAAATWPTPCRRPGSGQRRGRALARAQRGELPTSSAAPHTAARSTAPRQSAQFRPRRHRRDLTGAAARGDRVTHLVGAPQRHGDRRGQQVDDLQTPSGACGPAGWWHSLRPQPARRDTAPGTRRSASGRRAAPAPTPPPSRRPGSATPQRSAQFRDRRRDLGDIGGPRHQRAQPEQHDRQRGDPQEVEQAAEAEVRPDRSITGAPPANAAVTPPRSSRIHNHRGIDGSAPRGNARQPGRHQHQQAATSADRHPARVERQQDADRRNRQSVWCRPTGRG